MSDTECECYSCQETITNAIKCQSVECDRLICAPCLLKALNINQHLGIRCPHCKVQWDFPYLAYSLGSDFAKDYIKLFENSCFNVQKSKLPSSQSVAMSLLHCASVHDTLQTRKNELKTIRQQCDTCIEQIATVQDSLSSELRFDENTDITRVIGKIPDSVVDIISKPIETSATTSHNIDIYFNLLDTFIESTNQQSQQSQNDVKNLIRPCPQVTCRGYLDINYSCGICGIQICKDCAAPLNSDNPGTASGTVPENSGAPDHSSSSAAPQAAGAQVTGAHVCNPDELLTQKFITTETRPCPNIKCTAPCFRVSGCDQVWCWNCHTAWDWEGRTIIDQNNVRIDAQDYRDWKEQQDLNNPHLQLIGNINNFIRYSTFTTAVNTISSWLQLYKKLLNRRPHEFTEQAMNNLQTKLRIRYLLGEEISKSYAASQNIGSSLDDKVFKRKCSELQSKYDFYQCLNENIEHYKIELGNLISKTFNILNAMNRDNIYELDSVILKICKDFKCLAIETNLIIYERMVFYSSYFNLPFIDYNNPNPYIDEGFTKYDEWFSRPDIQKYHKNRQNRVASVTRLSKRQMTLKDFNFSETSENISSSNHDIAGSQEAIFQPAQVPAN